MALNFLLKRSGTADKRPDPASMALGELDLNYDAETGGVFYKDSDGNVSKVGSAQVSATAPNATPVGSSGNSDGEFWYDTVNSELKLWNGSAWVTIDNDVESVTGIAPIAVDNTDPLNPVISVDDATPTSAGVLPGTTTCFGTGVGACALKLSTGVFNVGVGVFAACNTTTGVRNTAIGSSALITNVSGSCNVVLGMNALRQGTANQCTTAVGFNALGGMSSSGSSNVALGQEAGCTQTTGNQNVIIGPNTRTASSTGSCQLVIGFSTTENWLTGDSTKAIQPGAGIIDCAGSCGTSGQVLSSNGSNAIEWIDAGGGGVAGVTGTTPITVDNTDPANPVISVEEATSTTFGTIKGRITTGSSVGVGCNALASGLGSNNVAVGACALFNTTSTGNSNTALGSFALRALTGGDFNVGVGQNALLNATTGSSNIAIGNSAFQAFNGTRSIAIGSSAGLNQTAGDRNVVIGPDVYLPSTTGSCQLAIGYINGQCWLTGNSTKAIKPGAGIIDRLNSCGTAGQVLSSTGANALEWIDIPGGGGVSGVTGTSPITVDNTDPANPVVSIDSASTTGAGAVQLNDNVNSTSTTEAATANAVKTAYDLADAAVPDSAYTALGDILSGTGAGTYSALPLGTNGNVLTADSACAGGVKWAAGGGGGGASPATPTAEGTVYGCTTATNSLIGLNAGANITSGVCNSLLGVGVGGALTTGSHNVFLGNSAGALTESGSGNVFLGCFAGCSNVGGSNGIAIGGGALQNAPSASCMIAIGPFALNSTTCSGSGNIAIGPQALRLWNQLSASNTASVAIGLCALRASNTAGASNVAIGTNVLRSDTNANQNVVIGTEAASASTSSIANTVVGFNAMQQGTVICGNVAVGRMAMQAYLGCYSVALGYNSLNGSSTGSNLIGIGCNAAPSSASVSNEVNIYNGSVTARFQGAASAWSFVSDARDKTNVVALPVGLDFVNQLQPRQFEWAMRDSDVDQGKPAAGFVAQEVDSIVEAAEAHYLNLVDKNDEDRYTLAQANLIPVLVKAIQELSAKNDALEARLAALEGN